MFFSLWNFHFFLFIYQSVDYEEYQGFEEKDEKKKSFLIKRNPA
jgi:hypothetical protein